MKNVRKIYSIILYSEGSYSGTRRIKLGFNFFPEFSEIKSPLSEVINNLILSRIVLIELNGNSNSRSNRK